MQPDSPSGPTPHTALAPSYAAHAATLGPTNFKLRQKTNTDTRSNHDPSRSLPRSFIFSFTFPYFTSLFSHSRTMLTDAKLLPRGIRTFSFTLFYLSLYALVRSIQSPSPAPPRSPLRYRSYRYHVCTVYKTAVLLVGASTLISSN
jgi:hypothetical protein